MALLKLVLLLHLDLVLHRPVLLPQHLLLDHLKLVLPQLLDSVPNKQIQPQLHPLLALVLLKVHHPLLPSDLERRRVQPLHLLGLERRKPVQVPQRSDLPVLKQAQVLQHSDLGNLRQATQDLASALEHLPFLHQQVFFPELVVRSNQIYLKHVFVQEVYTLHFRIYLFWNFVGRDHSCLQYFDTWNYIIWRNCTIWRSFWPTFPDYSACSTSKHTS